MKSNKRIGSLKARLGALFQVLIIILASKSYSSAMADDCITISGPDYVMVDDSAFYSASGSVVGGYSWSSASGTLTIDPDTGEVDAGNDPSSSEGDEEIDVVDSNGNTGGKNLTVFDIQSKTEAAAPDGTGDDRQTVGVGEKVTLTVVPDLSVTWSSDGDQNGVDNYTINDKTANPTTYTAAGKDVSQTITATFDNGDSGQIDFNVVSPHDETAEKDSSEKQWPAGTQGAGMDLIVTVNPTNVSFSNVEVIELSEYASNITGYFEDYDGNVGNGGLQHDPNPNWINLNNENKWADSAYFWGYPPPWRWGQFEWDIPVKWRVKESVNRDLPGGDLPNRLQHMEITGIDGTSVITKLGKSATRTP